MRQFMRVSLRVYLLILSQPAVIGKDTQLSCSVLNKKLFQECPDNKFDFRHYVNMLMKIAEILLDPLNQISKSQLQQELLAVCLELCSGRSSRSITVKAMCCKSLLLKFAFAIKVDSSSVFSRALSYKPMTSLGEAATAILLLMTEQQTIQR